MSTSIDAASPSNSASRCEARLVPAWREFWTQANALVEKCKEELRAEKIPFDEKMEVGTMIEIPSAALIADTLAQRSNFFSVRSS